MVQGIKCGAGNKMWYREIKCGTVNKNVVHGNKMWYREIKCGTGK